MSVRESFPSSPPVDSDSAASSTLRKDIAERVVEPIAFRVDQLLPKKPVKFDSYEESTAEFFRNPNSQPVEIQKHKPLGACLLVILKSIQRESELIGDRQTSENSAKKISTNIIIHAQEIATVIRGMYVLSEMEGFAPGYVEHTLNRESEARRYGQTTTALYILETAQKLGVVSDPQFEPLLHALHTFVISDPKLPNYAALRERYAGRLIEDAEYWEGIYAHLPVVAFPEADLLHSDMRAIAQQERQIRGTTVHQAVKKHHAYGTSVAKVSETYRSLPEQRRELKLDKEAAVRQEIRRWQTHLEPLMAELPMYVNDDSKSFLRNSLAIIASQFIRPDGTPDADLSQKAQSYFPDLADDTVMSEYRVHVDDFLDTSIRNKDPLLMWMSAFRNSRTRAKIIRSIQADPGRFVDLEKLMVNQLTKYGLLSAQGESELFFRRAASPENQELLEQIPIFIQSMVQLSQKYPAFDVMGHNRYTHRDNVEMYGKIASRLAEDPSICGEYLTPEYITAVARQSAIDRLRLLVPRSQHQLGLAYISLQLRAGKFAQNVTGFWHEHLSDALEIPNPLRRDYWRRKNKDAREIRSIDDQVHEVAQVLYSKRPINNLDKLPMVNVGIIDQELGNFLQPDEPLQESEVLDGTVEDVINKAQKMNADLALAIRLPNDATEIPTMWDHRIRYHVKLSQDDENTVWGVVYSTYTELAPISSKIKESSYDTKGWRVYSLHDTFDKKAALLFNDRLKNDEKLQALHIDLIDALDSISLDDERLATEVIKLHLKKIQKYFRTKRFYDARELDDDQTGSNLQYIADNPDVGFECIIAARAVKELLESVGIKATVLISVNPYFYKGGAYMNHGHAVALAILPNSSVVEIDFTPPPTFKTPRKIQGMLKPRIPKDPNEYQTRFEGGKLTASRAARLRRVVIGLLAGVAIGRGLTTVLDAANIHIPPLPQPAPGPENPNQQNSDSEAGVDFSQLLQNVLQGIGVVGGVGVTGFGLLKSYELLSNVKKKREVDSYKTNLEQRFNPDEQVVMASLMYPMQRGQAFNETSARKMLEILKEFDIKKRKPFLLAIAHLMRQQPEVVRPIFEEDIAAGKYHDAYHKLAKLVREYQPEDEHQQVWWQRLLESEDTLLASLENDEQAGGISEQDFDDFCKSLDILEVIAELRVQLDADLDSLQVMSEMGGDTTPQVAQALKTVSWETKRDLRNYIFQLNRSLENGAIELLTQKEIAEMADRVQEYTKSM